MTHSFDFLVLGSGIAGLSFALKAAQSGRVAIVTKKHRAESNTNYAQGGIAAVIGKEDSFEAHVRDTLEAGAGLCREAVVRTIVEEGPDRIRELIELGHDVIPKQPLPLVASELIAIVRSCLEGADIAIHFVGEHFGLVPEATELSVVALQNQVSPAPVAAAPPAPT